MATRDFIKIDRNMTPGASVYSSLLIQYINSVRQSYELAKKLEAIMNHNNDGTNFADMEALFGIPAGTGSVILPLVTGAIRDADAKALTERVG